MSQYLSNIYRACVTGAGEVIRAFEIARSWGKEHRRDQHPLRNRHLRRSKSPTNRPASARPPPSPSQAVVEPLLDRKRKSSGSPSPMNRAKRQDFGYFKSASSPWSNEPWEQRHSNDLHTRPDEAHDRDARMTRWKGKRGIRQPVRPPCYWNPFKYERSPSPPKVEQNPRVRLHHHRCPQYPNHFHQDIHFHSPDSEASGTSRAGQSMPREEEAPSQDQIDENKLQTTDFTPLKPAETEHVPRVGSETKPEPVENTEEEEDCDWDEEGNQAYRKLLRSMPESFDEDGYKLPIHGYVSPATQLWNEDRRQNLLEDAAHEQQTPSRLPRRTAPLTANGVQPEEDAPHLPPQTADEGEAELQATKEAKFDRDHPKISHIETVSAPPILEIQKLSLKPSKAERTPKAKSYEETKTERRKRNSERLAALEAAKDPYPLVPLSKAWDDKVRHAVNHGHGRFEATMFNKCLPEYSNDPRATSSWLDDAVINDYVSMVAKHGSKNDWPKQVPSVSALSSFFFTKISTPNPNYQSCARMLNKAGVAGEKLLDCEKVFIPINKTYHWTLAVIEPKIPAGLTASDRRRKVTIYNSMGSSGGQQVAEYIMRWIRHELGASFKEEEWEVNPIGESPQQRNSDDCGVFTCTTARQIMLGKYQDIKTRYKEPAIKDMRKRLVAELVNGALLNKDESAR